MTTKRTAAKAMCFGCAIMLLGQAQEALAGPPPEFAEWTSVDLTANTAVGSIGLIPVSITGGDISFSITNNSFQGFSNGSFFTPPTFDSDMLEIIGAPETQTYTIVFGTAVTNPVLHIGSLASVLDFGSTSLTKLSGQSSFVVSGSTITGELSDIGPNFDANGTVQVNGTFTTLDFSSTALPGLTVDGIALQVGAVIPAPSAALAMILAAGFSSRRRRRS